MAKFRTDLFNKITVRILLDVHIFLVFRFSKASFNVLTKYELLLDIVHDKFLTQLVKSPMRENNMLDLVFVTSPDNVGNVSVGAPFSDHNSMHYVLINRISL